MANNISPRPPIPQSLQNSNSVPLPNKPSLQNPPPIPARETESHVLPERPVEALPQKPVIKQNESSFKQMQTGAIPAKSLHTILNPEPSQVGQHYKQLDPQQIVERKANVESENIFDSVKAKELLKQKIITYSIFGAGCLLLIGIFILIYIII